MAEPPRQLTDLVAHRLLSRAAELDARHDRDLSLSELRAIALEAGIAPEAFDRAVIELAQAPAAGPQTNDDFWHRALQHFKVIGAFVITLMLLSRLSQGLDLGWQVRELVDVLALSVGAVTAHRLRSRLPKLAFIGLGAGTLVQWLVHLAFGLNTVQGAAAHWAILGTGLVAALGVSAVARMLPPPEAPRAPSAVSVASDAEKSTGHAKGGGQDAFLLHAV